MTRKIRTTTWKNGLTDPKAKEVWVRAQIAKGMTPAEIAEIVGMNPQSMRTYMHLRGIKSLPYTAGKKCIWKGCGKPIENRNKSGKCRKHRSHGEYDGTYWVFGLSKEEYDAMHAENGGACQACGKLPNGKRNAVDHDHATGEVRGILCNSCNRALGLLDDDPKKIQGLLDYILRSV